MAARRASSLLAKKGVEPLSLNGFIVRSRVLALYREMLRATARIKDQSTRKEMRQWARTEFDSQRRVQDSTTIRYLIAKGKAQFDGMRRYIDEQAS